MKPLAHLEMLVVGLGLSFMGGPSAFYDLSDEDQIAALAFAIVAAEAPELNPGPIAWNGLVKLHNDAHRKEG